MSKKIQIEHTQEINQLNIMEGESVEIILNRQNNHSIACFLLKKNGVCSIRFYDPDTKNTEAFKWEDKP